jgi:hypothetical protein
VGVLGLTAAMDLSRLAAAAKCRGYRSSGALVLMLLLLVTSVLTPGTLVARVFGEQAGT